MKNFISSFKKTSASKKGFTLIEILVVIGIIAILATIVLVAINPARQFKQANNTQRTSSINAILNAIGQYQADNKGALPANLSKGTKIAAGTTNADICNDLVPKYISALPFDPSIPAVDCLTDNTYDTGFTVTTSGGRVTVSAAKGEDPDGSGAKTLTVTR